MKWWPTQCTNIFFSFFIFTNISVCLELISFDKNFICKLCVPWFMRVHTHTPRCTCTCVCDSGSGSHHWAWEEDVNECDAWPTSSTTHISSLFLSLPLYLCGSETRASLHASLVNHIVPCLPYTPHHKKSLGRRGYPHVLFRHVKIDFRLKKKKNPVIEGGKRIKIAVVWVDGCEGENKLQSCCFEAC